MNDREERPPRARRRFEPRAEGPPPDAFETAVRLLALRPHSAVELRRKLRQRGCPEERIDAAIARAQELGYQSDVDFAASLVRTRSTSRGRLAMAADLARRGVDREAAGDALAGVTPEDELTTARAIAARMPSIEAGRLGGRLQRRGFSSEVVRRVVRERRG
ncbi:MAG: regulatory protein RecX [Candidatus Dormibacteraceae bacterium]